MLVNVGFATQELHEKLWPVLEAQAQELQLQLALTTQADSLYFSQEANNPKVLTLIGSEGVFPLENFSHQSVRLLLCWHRDRLILEGLRQHRHTLGNLIVIFLSRVMRLGDKIDPVEHDGLMKLHGRFTELYAEFEKLNATRPTKLAQKNS